MAGRPQKDAPVQQAYDMAMQPAQTTRQQAPRTQEVLRREARLLFCCCPELETQQPSNIHTASFLGFGSPCPLQKFSDVKL
jgi:hypothetical protein